MKPKHATSILLLALMLAAAISALGDDKTPLFTTKPKSIAMFKNGLGFFVREGTATLNEEGWAVTDVVPTAALGTFWVGSSEPGVSIERLISMQEDITLSLPAVSVQEMLASNVGKNVTITICNGTSEGKVISGKLIAVPPARMPDFNRPTYPIIQDPPSVPSDLVLIETTDGTVAMSAREVGQVEFQGMADTNCTSKETVKRLRFKVAGAEKSCPITVGYLQKGVSWSPAYLVELKDDKAAQITMQGLVMDDIEDIDGTDVYFVVGYPNFMFSDILTPLALTQSLANFTQAISQPNAGRFGGGGFAAQAAGGFFGNSSSGYGYANNQMPEGITAIIPYGSSNTAANGLSYQSTGTPGAPEEDLFLYQVKNVSLKRGERAYYTVFSAEVPYKHIYEWNIPDTSQVQSNGYMNNSNPSSPSPPTDQVWHKLRLTNNSQYPWTSAPGMAMSNGQPLAQDIIDYTPKGGDSDLKITIATDIKPTATETEVSRQTGITLIPGWSPFTKVAVSGKLSLKSFKMKPVTVSVKKTVIGEVTLAGEGGSVEKIATGIQMANPTSVISWEVPVGPGEEKVLDYTYETYIRQ